MPALPATYIKDASPDARFLAMALMALLIVRVAALALTRTDLFFDEAQYWAWGREIDFGYFSKPPVIAWVIRLVTGACGETEFCVRLASPLLHTGAAIFIFAAARALYDARVGVWSALVYATLPGISYSSGLISTDVPLLFFWCAALFLWVRLMQTRALEWAVGLGIAIGLGLMSKYAMAYFWLAIGLFLVADRPSRWLATSLHGVALIVIPLIILAPNLLWNLEHGLVTFSHTAANAKWQGVPLHPLKALEFIGAQFGVFGPVLMGVLIWIVGRRQWRQLDARARMLLCFSVPIIVLITVQAFLSRAHANWAATAYPAAAILVTATMLQPGWKRLFRLSLVLHLAVIAALAVGGMTAPRLGVAGKGGPYARVLGWNEIAEATRGRWNDGHYTILLTEDRQITATLLYYLRDSGIPIRAWKPEDGPRDHFELTRPFDGRTKGPMLLVAIRPSVAYLTSRFRSVTDLGATMVPAGSGHARKVQFHALDGYKAKEP